MHEDRELGFDVSDAHMVIGTTAIAINQENQTPYAYDWIQLELKSLNIF